MSDDSGTDPGVLGELPASCFVEVYLKPTSSASREAVREAVTAYLATLPVSTFLSDGVVDLSSQPDLAAECEAVLIADATGAPGGTDDDANDVDVTVVSQVFQSQRPDCFFFFVFF